ncbi:BTB domain-containing protein [Rhizoctonia solani AG-1 IA]|uniref:BTB domain-containing protein n=1 Tax=Thanatephorus cucumeris (strain AG1-IA) TaxID=983506 RepID=L8WE29_THACA|nr:BTB domain-containing protein [Rhizoctonia solani AG-1 IA]
MCIADGGNRILSKRVLPPYRQLGRPHTPLTVPSHCKGYHKSAHIIFSLGSNYLCILPGIIKMAKKKAAPRNGHTGPRMFIDRELDAEPNGDEPNTTSDTEASESLIRHPEFFFDNTLVAIQSKVFSDRFKRSKADDGEPKEGSSPEHPIKLGDISASDFASLMRVLYASNQPALEANLIIPAFRLAHIFDFSDLYAFLLPLAEENLDDANKIVFARELEITKWLVPSHVRLCKREKPLTTQEAKKIGVESVLLISRMREQHRCQSPRLSLTIGKYYCDNCAGVTYEPVGGYKCWGCATHTNAGLLCNGTGHTRVPVVDDDAIEAGVKKWVKDGCTIKDLD